jgi:predicted O-linked N-acetylglucosamine transferase (SPINDLY family)
VRSEFSAAAAAYAEGNLSRAEGLCQSILGADPHDLTTLNLLGIIKAQTGRLGESAELFSRAVTLSPDDATLQINYANVLGGLGRNEEALAVYAKATQLDASNAQAHFNRARLLSVLGDSSGARAGFEATLALNPTHPEAHYNHGVVLHRLGRTEDALNSYSRALQLNPRLWEAHYNQGLLLHALRRFDEAVASYDRALQLVPGFAQAHNNRGTALHELGRFREAASSYQEALRANPSLADAYNNLGNAQRQLDQLEDALSSYAEALRLEPGLHWLLGAWFHTKLQLCDWSELEPALQRIQSELIDGRKIAQPFTLLAVTDDITLQRRAGEVFASAFRPVADPPAPVAKTTRRQRIHIGYFSADFYDHATTRLMADLIDRHDRRRFEVSGFWFGGHDADQMTRRLERSFDHFVPVHAKSDREVALLSRDLNVDIAVDLKGFTEDSRPGIFAYRAAPQQVSYLGYPGTMGVADIDYIIADEAVIPRSSAGAYAEKVIYLPHCYQINSRAHLPPMERASRAQYGLPERAFVFCCFNGCYKISPHIFASWMTILKAVPESVLWLLAQNRTVVANLRAAAEHSGIAGDRLVFGNVLPPQQHLDRYRAADLFLDTFPYGAHTTASDALWCGVPLVTRCGVSFASRVAASLLRTLELPELIAASQEAYEALAVALARDRVRLATLQQRLAANRQKSVLFNAASTTMDLEAAYQRIYDDR